MSEFTVSEMPVIVAERGNTTPGAASTAPGRAVTEATAPSETVRPDAIAATVRPHAIAETVRPETARPQAIAADPVAIGSTMPEPDLVQAELAARDFLSALGISLEPEHLQKTPARMARAWAEMLTPRPFELTTFPNDEGYDELVIVRDIPVRSICEHHLLPFRGRACVAYLPGERIVGLSKLARIVEHFACRPQTQERLTKQVADWLQENLQPRAVGVVVEAEHSCMTLRGAEATGASTVTSALLGQLREDPRSRQEFLALSGIAAPSGIR